MTHISPPQCPCAKVFQGGNFRHLHTMLGVNSGAQVLYVARLSKVQAEQHIRLTVSV